MAEPQRRYTIGYALAAKKQQSFIQESLLSAARKKGIDLIKIDLDRPLSDQGPFDCVLHKLYGDDWKIQLSQFKSQNPNAVVIDSLENIEVLHNRVSMLNVVVGLDDIRDGDSTFGIPNQVVVYDREGLFDGKVLGGLKFPVIAKPLVADGSAKSHKMVLVFNSGGLGKLKPPIVLQEFVNHGGVIFKVYVVGEYVKCVKRKSLPDVAEDSVESLEDCLPFSQVSNLGSKERNDDSYLKMKHLEDAEMPPEHFLKDIADGLRNALGLNLFNFDVIRDTKIGNRYLVVDINYFPGYAKMPGYENVLADFFFDVLRNDKEVVTVADAGSFAGEGLGGKEDKLGLDTLSRVGKMVSNTCGSDEEDSRVPVSPVARDEKESQVQV